MNDVRETLKNKKLKPGLNLIDKTASSLSLFAESRDGKIIRWLVKDKTGKEIPTTAEKKKKMCLLCIRRPDGGRDCWIVPCDSITIHPTDM